MSALLDQLLTPAQRKEVAAADAYDALQSALAAKRAAEAKQSPAIELEDDDATSLQPFGMASVLVCFRTDSADVQVTGALINGDFVDADLFACSVVNGWKEAIQREAEQDRLFASWGE